MDKRIEVKVVCDCFGKVAFIKTVRPCKWRFIDDIRCPTVPDDQKWDWECDPQRDDCPQAQYSSGTVSRARTLQRDSDGNMTPVMISPILRQNVGKITVKTVNSPVKNYQNSQVPLQKYDFLRSSNRKDAMISQASEKVRSLHAQLRAIKQHDMKMSKNHAEEIEILQARFAKEREAIENAKQEKKEFFQKTLEDRNSDIASMKAEVDFFSYEF